MAKKSPTKKLFGKITKYNPILESVMDPDKMLKKHPKGKKIVDFVSSLVLQEEKNRPGKRKQFSKITREKVLEYQQYRCKLCGTKSDVWDFDHINGNRGNNEFSNCQALCPNCHAKKTRNQR
jgi:5-methylcytosine-specific restriction endonuclease McrA